MHTSGRRESTCDLNRPRACSPSMRLPAILLLLLCATRVLGAQDAASTRLGLLEGTIIDSVRAAPLAGASVSITRVDPRPSLSYSARSDSAGRYRVDGLPPGRYLVGFTSSFLDSLEFPRSPRQVTVAPGHLVRANLAIPSGATLRAAACPGLLLPKKSGAVLGLVTDAETDQPLLDAHVIVAWTELRVDSATRRPVPQQLAGEVKADSLGQYRLCGVPTDSPLLIQLQQKTRVGSAIQLLVPEGTGVVVRHLSFSRDAARVIAALDTARADSSSKSLRGTAILTGVVRGRDGEPLSDAQVRVADTDALALSDAGGRFTLSGLPAGTQLVEARRAGYLIAQQGVELRSGRTVTEDVRLQRIVFLDSIGIVAQRSPYTSFDANRKDNFYGVFLTEDQITERRAAEVADLVRVMAAFRIEGRGMDARVLNARRYPLCEPNIVIDGVQRQSISLLTPNQVGAMEAYWSAAGAPPQFDAGCGVIVLWTRR